MSLLTIAQTALRESGQYTVPSTIVGNTDPTAVQLLALANRTGRTIANDYRWQALLKSYTFDTVASTASYALPGDFGRFANLTFWDNTNYQAVRGPVTAVEWQMLQSSMIANAGITKAFRLASNLFYIYPTPDAAETIAYNYYSKYWADSTGSKAAFSNDSDEPLIDEDLVTLGLRWRWLSAKGDAFENEKLEYLQRLESLQAADGGRDAIRFGERMTFMPNNLPDTGFGL